MKRYALWVKFLTFFLAVVTLLCVAVSALGILLAESMNMYRQDNYEQWYYDRYNDRAMTIADQVLQEYGGSLSDCPDWVLEQTGYANAIVRVEGWFSLDETNWCYTLTDADGKILLDTYNADLAKDMLEYSFLMDTHYPMLGTSDEVLLNPMTDETVKVHYVQVSDLQVTVWLDPAQIDYYYDHGLSQIAIQKLYEIRYICVVAVGVCLLLFLGAMSFLLYIAGKDPKTGEANPKAFNRLPLDLYLAAAVFVTLLGAMAIYELMDMLFYNDGYSVLIFVLQCGCGIAVAMTDVGFFTALAAQAKMPGGYWWKHSVCGRVLMLGWKLFRKVWGYVAKGFRRAVHGITDMLAMMPIIWQWIAVGAAFGLVLLVICASTTAHWYSVIPLAMWCLTFAAVVSYCGYCYGTIHKGIKRMNEGNLNGKINTEWLFGSFKTIAEELNALADVAAIAAEKQLKSERMKAELITNVSHDIKTPLTSVINYVDLLQQPHTEEEGIQYLEVLSRQSLRLKKLVDDLMDMSKASTGNVPVCVESLDAVETVNQALGEFADKLEQVELTPIFRSQTERMSILADGRITWRVLSNLLSNVVKYALPGTRVYLDLICLDKQVILSVKNISREELNISAEELTERFVRGDVSRNTEGSGLGLNIAQSLMQLQSGSLEVTVDGDLFKVTLAFPTE